MRVREKYEQIISKSSAVSEQSSSISHNLFSDVENEFIPPIAVGGNLQHLLNSEVKKLQDSFPNLNCHIHHDILTESRRMSPYQLLGQGIVTATQTSSSLYIDCAASNGAHSNFVVSFEELNPSSAVTEPNSSNFNELLSRSAQSFLSPYQYLVMKSDGTVAAAESITHTGLPLLNGSGLPYNFCLCMHECMYLLRIFYFY